jgi:polyisoprenoid-binding protein YceI
MRLVFAALAASVLVSPPASALAAPPSTDPAAAPAGHYVLDPRHTSVTASVLHMGLSHFTMRIGGVTGAYDYDPKAPEASKITVSLDARTLDAGDPNVSKTFAGEFLDAGKNPQITFVSTQIQPTTVRHGSVVGDLTFRGVTHPVTLDVTYNGTVDSLIGGRRMGFSATTVIRRSDFGSEAWKNAVGDDVQVVIETEFAKQ